MNLPAVQETWRGRFAPWIQEVPRGRKRQPIPVFLTGKSHGQKAWQATVNGVTKSWTGPSDSVVAIKHGHGGFLHLFVSPLACFISALVFCVKIFRLPVLCCASLLSRV